MTLIKKEEYLEALNTATNEIPNDLEARDQSLAALALATLPISALLAEIRDELHQINLNLHPRGDK